MARAKLVYPILMVALVAALALSTFDMARLVLARMPGQPAVDRLLAGEDVSPEGFERIRRSREKALSIEPTAQDAVELGLAQTFEALTVEGLDEARQEELLRGAIAYLQSGLAEAPVSYNGWYALALAHFVLNDIPQAAQAFNAAMLLTPFAGHNLSSRLRLGMALWSDLSDEAQDQIEDEIIFAARFRPFELVALAMQTGLEREVRALLASVDDDSRLLERYGVVQLRLIRESMMEARRS